MLRPRGPNVPVVSTIFDSPAKAESGSTVKPSAGSNGGAGGHAALESCRGAVLASWQAQRVAHEGRAGFGNTTKPPSYGIDEAVEYRAEPKGNPKTRQLQQVTNARVASHVQFQMLVNFQMMVVLSAPPQQSPSYSLLIKHACLTGRTLPLTLSTYSA